MSQSTKLTFLILVLMFGAWYAHYNLVFSKTRETIKGIDPIIQQKKSEKGNLLEEKIKKLQNIKNLMENYETRVNNYNKKFKVVANPDKQRFVNEKIISNIPKFIRDVASRYNINVAEYMTKPADAKNKIVTFHYKVSSKTADFEKFILAIEEACVRRVGPLPVRMSYLKYEPFVVKNLKTKRLIQQGKAEKPYDLKAEIIFEALYDDKAIDKQIVVNYDVPVINDETSEKYAVLLKNSRFTPKEIVSVADIDDKGQPTKIGKIELSSMFKLEGQPLAAVIRYEGRVHKMLEGQKLVIDKEKEVVLILKDILRNEYEAPVGVHIVERQRDEEKSHKVWLSGRGPDEDNFIKFADSKDSDIINSDQCVACKGSGKNNKGEVCSECGGDGKAAGKDLEPADDSDDLDEGDGGLDEEDEDDNF